MSEITGYMSMSVQGVINAIAPAFEQQSGHRLAITYNTSASLNKRLLAGETADVLINTRPAMDALLAAGKVVRGSVVDLAHSAVGIAVKAGAAKPDISSRDALIRALRAAGAIGYSDPAGGGASGVHFEKLIKALNLFEELRPKIKYPPVGTFTATMLLNDEVDLAVQQVAELKFVSGIEVLGPLPDDLQHITVFVGAVHAEAKEPQAAQALLDVLRTPTGAAAIRSQGLEPV